VKLKISLEIETKKPSLPNRRHRLSLQEPLFLRGLSVPASGKKELRSFLPEAGRA
jgi:hypothetical protein